MRVEDINQELDEARREGPVRDIVIPACPELLTELQVEVRKADPDPLAIAQIAGSDVAMAASLMRIANSPMYARARPARTVSEALAMLGVGQAIAVLTGFLTRSAIRIDSPLVEHFWETSTRRSLAMAYIARQLYGIDADVAQTCGLFCHVGIPIMLQGLPGYPGTMAEALARQDRSFTQTENAVHKTDHAVVGAIVARTWRLPPVVSFVVRLHHDFTCLDDKAIPSEVKSLVAISSIAEHLVADFEGVKQQIEWKIHAPACLSHLQISDSEVEHWIDALHPVFEGVVLS